jgi:hypothetical protein
VSRWTTRRRPTWPSASSCPFKISTHCGFDFRVDFDGSFWQAYTHEAYAPVYGFVHGTMTLLTEEVAVFRSRRTARRRRSTSSGMTRRSLIEAATRRVVGLDVVVKTCSRFGQA